jgi:hypothetical protein
MGKIGDKMHVGVAKVMTDFGLDPNSPRNVELYQILSAAWLDGFALAVDESEVANTVNQIHAENYKGQADALRKALEILPDYSTAYEREQ